MRELEPAWPPGAFDSTHEHVEPFRRAVDGRRQAGRPGADDDDVAHVRRIDAGVEAEAARRSLRLLGIAQHGVAATDHDRHVGARHVKLRIEQILGVLVVIEVDDR